MSGSLPGTWTGTDTPGEMSPVKTKRERLMSDWKHVKKFKKKKSSLNAKIR